MERLVKDDGHSAAKILLIGEAPGRDEMAMGYPFAGASGRELAKWWKPIGLHRSDMYVTNILGEIPPAKDGSIDEAIKYKTLSPEQVRAGFDYVKDIAEGLPDLSVICPVGNYASYPFTPGGKVHWDRSKPGITSIRGSIYRYTLESGRDINVVPTIHPAAVMRQPTWEKRCRRDWQRIAALVDQPYMDPPERQHKLHPTVSEIETWVNEINPGQSIVGLDIETWGDTIQCVGLATNPYESLVIPTTLSYWGDDRQYDRVRDCLREIVENPAIDLCMQNGLFDSWWLHYRWGFKVAGFHWDTLAMHHALDPLDNHSLDYMASIHTTQPYWKDEAKAADEIVRIAKEVGIDRLYVYNGIDVTVMMELRRVFQGMLERRGMMDFYFKHYADMHEPLLGMMRRGVPVDRVSMQRQWRDHLMNARRLRDEASKLTEKPLYKFDTTKCERDMQELYAVDQAWVSDEEWQRLDSHIFAAIKKSLLDKGHKEDQIHKKWVELAKKQISDTILGKLLYDEWKAPKGSTTKTGRYQVDNVALKTTANRARERVRLERKDDIISLVDLVIRHRREGKLGAFLNVERLDPDDHMRCEYRFATRSGRLASRENPRGNGANLQNYDRTLKSIFIPRPGHIIVEVDLSQAESRVVKVCTGDLKLVQLARRHPAEFDEHRHNAALIFSVIEGRNIDPEEITYEQRQLGKRVVHATNYAMGAKELSRTILRETGDAVTPSECAIMIKAYIDENPEIETYQANVRRTIMRTDQLYTSWGRRVDFKDIRRDTELYKFGYSYIPQSEIGDLTNQWGLKPLDAWIRENDLQSEIILQVHDSIVADCPPHEAWYVMHFLEKSLSRPRRYGKCLGFDIPLSIPVEFAAGASWKTTHEWKSLPTQEEVEQACEEILMETKYATA